MKRSDNKGFSLIEVMIAAFIFVLALGGLLDGMSAYFGMINLAKDETVALTHVRSMMEGISATAFSNMNVTFPNNVTNATIENSYQNLTGNFTLYNQTRLTNETIVVTYINASADPLEVKVRLTWQDRRNRWHDINASTFKTR